MLILIQRFNGHPANIASLRTPQAIRNTRRRISSREKPQTHQALLSHPTGNQRRAPCNHDRCVLTVHMEIFCTTIDYVFPVIARERGTPENKDNFDHSKFAGISKIIERRQQDRDDPDIQIQNNIEYNVGRQRHPRRLTVTSRAHDKLKLTKLRL
eukprot:948871-Prorocentrum_minimum.AAC.4